MATHHACDDYDKMIRGDPGMEDIYLWGNVEDEDGSTNPIKNEAYRGARGAGDGVHILTGPIYVEDAQVGDILKVDIIDLQPRRNPETGRTFGSNAAAWYVLVSYNRSSAQPCSQFRLFSRCWFHVS